MEGLPETDGIKTSHEEETLYHVLHRMLSTVFSPDFDRSKSLLMRINNSLTENAPLLKDDISNTGREVLLWTRRGGPLRELLVISVGTITLLTLTGLLAFMLFFLAATVNAIVVSLLISLAAVGGFMVLFFACVTAIYIGALSVAAFVIFSATISSIIAVFVAIGWIIFFWAVWLMAKKIVGVAKHTLSMTGSAISAYSSGGHVLRYQELDKVSN